MNAPLAIEILNRSLVQADTQVTQHRQNEEHYLRLRDEERAKRLRAEAKFADIFAAIEHLEAASAQPSEPRGDHADSWGG